jgi:uncharacterized protein (TIGR00661 family)
LRDPVFAYLPARLGINMARVIYGVMGNTYGHIARTQAIVRRLPEHEWYFVGGGRVPELLGSSYPVLEVPVKRTIHKQQRVSIPATIKSIASCLQAAPEVRWKIRELIECWQPSIAFSDREIFLPSAARAAGLECVSIDHSHVLLACRYPVPPSQLASRALARIEDELLFNATRRNLIVSFFHPELKRPESDELLPPVLRTEVKEIRPSAGDDILIYQTSPTFGSLIEATRQLSRRVIVYGFKPMESTEGNLTFKPFHPRQILEDLASCAYAVVNGGHNLICEALAYTKPLLCFPIAWHFEQFLNASYVRRLGYGDYSLTRQPTPELFHHFEQRLEEYRQNISRDFVDGTEAVVNRAREIIG